MSKNSSKMNTCGLSNLGNTCYLNSSLQILFNTPGLFDGIKKYYNNSKTQRLLFTLIQLYDGMENQNSVYPSSFVNELHRIARKKKNINFSGYDQNDAAEFILFLFDNLHEMIKIEVEMKITGSVKSTLDHTARECYKRFIELHEKDYSIFTKLFYFMTVTTNSSISDNTIVSQSFQSNFMFDLPIPISKGSCSLDQCLHYYFKDFTMSGENAIFNDRTKKKVDCIQRGSIWNLPPVFIIALKRFSFDGRKNNTYVNFPLDKLDMSRYICGYKTTATYRLYGICNHSGNVGGGHYTSYVRKQGNWYHFNDSSVTEISNNNTIVTPKAYLLFYHRYVGKE